MQLNRYLDLCKPKIVLLLTLTALVGMMLSTNFYNDVISGLASLLGFAFLAASSAALNQIFDKETDKNMQRTKDRPLASGNITLLNALIFYIYTFISWFISYALFLQYFDITNNYFRFHFL